MSFKFFLPLILVAGVISATQAQQSYTLPQAIEHGLAHRPDIRVREIGVSIAENEAAKLDSRVLPTVKASFDTRYNAILQTSIIPGVVLGRTEDVQVQFGTAFSTLIGVQANQSVYDPELRYDRAIALARVNTEQQNVAAAQTDTRVAIAEAYYGVLLAQEKVRLDRDNILRTKAYYDQVLAQQANQTALPTDVTRRQLDYLNAQTTLEQDEITLRKSQMALAQRMGLAQEATLPVVADRLESLLADTTSITAEVANAWERRVEMQQEMAQYRVYELNETKYKRQYLPTVSAYGNLFEQHLSNDYNIFKGENWQPYAFVGIQVGVDLFDGFRRKRLANEFALRMRNSETLQERLRLDINYEARITREEMVASLRAVRVARRNYDLAKQLVEVDKVRVQEGTLTPAELQNTEYAVMQAQNGLLGSLYNFLVARLRWQKATGQLG